MLEPSNNCSEQIKAHLIWQINLFIHSYTYILSCSFDQIKVPISQNVRENCILKNNINKVSHDVLTLCVNHVVVMLKPIISVNIIYYTTIVSLVHTVVQPFKNYRKKKKIPPKCYFRECKHGSSPTKMPQIVICYANCLHIGYYNLK